MRFHDVSGEFLFNPPKWWQRLSCRWNVNHWPWLHGNHQGKCRWCGAGDLDLDSQGNHYRKSAVDRGN